jgi:hypothetical protein
MNIAARRDERDLDAGERALVRAGDRFKFLLAPASGPDAFRAFLHLLRTGDNPWHDAPIRCNSTTSVAAVQDLIALYCGANMACELNGIVLGQITGTTVQNLRISVKRLPATVTAARAATRRRRRSCMRGDAAATATARVNDTTQATTSGTAAVLHERRVQHRQRLPVLLAAEGHAVDRP